MSKFLLGVSLTVNVAALAMVKGVHTTQGANILCLYLKNRGYLAERS